jgi:hypothetical protein
MTDDMSVLSDDFSAEFGMGDSFGNSDDIDVDQDDMSIKSGVSFDTREDLGDNADDLIASVEKYLQGYDGPIKDDPEMLELQTALREARESLESARENARTLEKERQFDIENAKQNVKRSKRANRERRESMDGSVYSSAEAEEMRRLVTVNSDDELVRSGHEMDSMNQKFEAQKRKIRRKSTKRESLAVEMKLGARKALRRLRMIGVRARIAREEAEKAKVGTKVDMSEKARRDRIYSCYSRYAMPTKEQFKVMVSKMPVSYGSTVKDIDLLPWDARGMRVNIAKINQVLMGLRKPDW